MAFNVHGGEDRRQHVSVGESTLTVKWWSVVAMFAILFAAFSGALLNHENRITRTEEAAKVIMELKASLNAIEMEIKTVNTKLTKIEARWEYIVDKQAKASERK